MKPNKTRSRVVIALLTAVPVIFCIRLLFLQVINYDFYLTKSRYQLNKLINLIPKRGEILDRNLKPLAVSQDAYSAYAVPPEIPNKAAFAHAVAPYLKKSEWEIFKMLNTRFPFVWLERKLDPATRDQLKALKLPGMNFIQENKRFYPNQSLASHIIGFVGTDGGLAGLEFQYNSTLAGKAGKIILEGDPRGYQIISGKKEVRQSIDGGNIVLTIDDRIQYFAEKYLQEAMQEYQALKGAVIVMNPQNAEILAIAGSPDFNPNRFWESPGHTLKNSALTDVYEPGSVFKIFTIAGALEDGIVTPDTAFVVPATLQLANKTIREAHGRIDADKPKTVTDILSESLNVGTTMIALRMEEARLYKYVRAFGFGKAYRIGLPGESAGLVRHPKQWSAVDIGMISFGQGIGVTPLQITAGISTIANGGKLYTPRIIKYITDNNGTRITSPPKTLINKAISPQTAAQITRMMVHAIEKGTATNVRIPGYKVAGKTGTAQKAAEGGLGYTGQYIASFGGFFPAENPQYVILVVIDSPKGAIYGSVVAGPVFKKLASRIIALENIKPTDLTPITAKPVPHPIAAAGLAD